MYSDQLARAAQKLGLKNFIGVFALNRLPKSLSHYSKPLSFIVNTDSSNLPGTHWLAVSYAEGGIVRVFDPFGVFYPDLLTSYLAKQAIRRVYFNTTTYQDPRRRTCGLHCLIWLKAINSG